MSALARRAADVSVGARIRRWVENVLPWYSPEEERKHRAYTADLEERGARAISGAEQVRKDYLKAAGRLRR